MYPFFLESKSWSFLIIALLIITIIAPKSVFGDDETGNYSSCSARLSCGGIRDIGYPFWGSNRPRGCGYSGFSLNCNIDVLEITIKSVTYRVLNIVRASRILKLARLDYYDNICPSYLINSTFDPTLFQLNSDSTNITLHYGCNPFPNSTTQFDCNINGTDTIGYVSREPTIDNSLASCNDSVIVPVHANPSGVNDATKALRDGFELQWYAEDSLCDKCMKSGGQCGHNISLNLSERFMLITGISSPPFICFCSAGNGTYPTTCPQGPSHFSPNLIIGLAMAAACLIVAICIVCFVIPRLKQKPTANGNSKHQRQPKMNHNGKFEAFIKNQGCFAPKRYSYLDIKKMTDKFKDKLGQGGYGSVYKGKLSDGRLVAVKVLSESKGNGEEFMNEVASISRTSHVNVVTLLGFCFEQSKRALVYEFMPNGSLDKFIYSQSRQLGWKALYDIALGIARGLEYLHQGCNTRILHFDIKPHNILLDDNFCPKISDFGLSKLCERKESIISMEGARGTMGYIAPEVYCRNFGGVSHKYDVYSYGMMVLEMVGGRKNLDVGASKTSEIYFPSWIYKHLDQAMNLSLDGIRAEEEEEITRKLVVVSLWCIQSDPSDRPSMTKVLEMLQGSVQSLVTPPRPFVSSPARSPQSSPTTSLLSLSIEAPQ